MPAFSRFFRYFMAVGRRGSIRRAAEELNVSASAVDRQILAAEADLGTALFERQSTGLRLTAAGEIMMAAGVRWEKGLADVRGQIEDLRGLRRGHVEIAVIDALAAGFVPRLVRRIRDQYPGITIGTRVLDNRAVRDAIVAGEVDFGLYLEPQTYRDLVVRVHCDVSLGFVVPPAHPFAAMPALRFAGSAGHPLVLPAPPLAVAEQIAILQGATGMTPLVAASSDNILMVKSLVLEGLGAGVLASLDVIPEVEAGALRFIEITDPILRPMTLALCTASSRALSSAANLVLADAESHFAMLGTPVAARAT
jgi:DNA-binding transcriptional LysR family regulator